MAWSGQVQNKERGYTFINETKQDYHQNNAKNRDFEESDNFYQSQRRVKQNQCGGGGLTKIEDVQEGFSNITIVGMIIAKESSKSIFRKNSNGTERHLISFVLRDSPGGFVNVTCWGGEPYIKDVSNSYGVGDIVQISKFTIHGKPSDGSEDKYRPSTPVPFNISLSEDHSTLCMYGGWDLDEYTNLLRFPTKANNDFYTLEDVMANTQNLDGEHINLCVTVKKIGQTKDITTKTGKKTQRCELKIFDETLPSFPLILWDKEQCALTLTWTPYETVLFIADVRVSFDNFRSSMIGTADSKTIFTVNPDTPVAFSLYQFAQTEKSQAEEKDDEQPDPPLETIQDIYEIQSIKEKMSEIKSNPFSTQVYGLTYCFLTQFNVDSDTSSIVRSRCDKCMQIVDRDNGYACSNAECTKGALFLFDPLMNNDDAIVEYNIPVSLTDHTGTIERCHIYGSIAESMTACQAKQFKFLGEQQRTLLKWKYLLEKVKVYFKLSRGRGDFGSATIKLLSCTLADPSF